MTTLRDHFANAAKPKKRNELEQMLDGPANVVGALAARFNAAFGIKNSATGQAWDQNDVNAYDVSIGLAAEEERNDLADYRPWEKPPERIQAIVINQRAFAV